MTGIARGARVIDSLGENKAPTGGVSIELSILFLGLARDCEGTLPIFFSFLDRLERHGFRCTAIIGENGSRDKTRLLICRAGPKIELLDTTFMAVSSGRLVRMARGRQALLDRAKARGLTERYVCVTDLDNVMMAPPDPKDLQSAIECLQADNSLFAIGATSTPFYYDLLALRAEGHDYTDLNRELTEAKQWPLSYFQFHHQRIYAKQRQMTRPEPIACASSFNGFCLYNANDYVLGAYRAPDEADVSEHVSLNLSIGRATGKKMLITPGLVIHAPSDHCPVGFFQFWFDRIRKQLIVARNFVKSRSGT